MIKKNEKIKKKRSYLRTRLTLPAVFSGWRTDGYTFKWKGGNYSDRIEPCVFVVNVYFVRVKWILMERVTGRHELQARASRSFRFAPDEGLLYVLFA